MKTIKITQEKHIDVIKYLTSELNQIIDENKDLINNIATNGNLASVLQESFYSINFERAIIDENGKKQQFFQIGIFCNLPLNVDVLQSWSNNDIHLKNDDKIIETIKIEDENDILI